MRASSVLSRGGAGVGASYPGVSGRAGVPAGHFRPRLSLALLFLCLSFPALAQSPIDRLVGRRITDVRLVLEGGRPATSDVDISRVLETEAGTPLSTSAVRESIVHLMAMSRFQDVRVNAEEVDGGVRLTYELVPLRSIKRIAFRGEVALPVNQLRTDALNRYGASPPASRAEDMARVLEAYYHDHGFLSANVQPSVESKPGDKSSTLVFQVTAGPRVRIGAVDVQGAPDGAGGAVAQRLGLIRNAPFDAAGLRERVTSFVDDLRARGFIEAKVEAEPEYLGGDTVDVKVRMNRGPHVTLAFRGDPLPASRSDELATIRREGTIDEDMLENEQRSVEDELRAEGFRDAEVRYDREARSSDEVAIVFTIRRGAQYRVARVEITGNQHLSRSVLQPSLRLAAAQWFVKSRLDADRATIAERYRRDGFASVKVEASVTSAPTPASLDVVLAVTEGPRTHVDSLDFAGNAALEKERLREEVRSRPGSPYYEPAINADREAVLLQYLNRGYELANVDVQTTFSPDRTLAGLKFVIVEGPQIRIDHVLIVGNARTKVTTIEREAGLQRGMALSLLRLSEAQARLNALGLFRRVQVTELQRGSETDRDVLIVVDEAAPNTIGYGGGLEVFRRPKTNTETGEVERIFDVVPRGFVEYGRRNLWGKNRSINVFARAAVRSSNLSDGGNTTPGSPTSGFREYRLLGTYREPRAFGSGVDLAATAVAEQASRPSFDFERRQVVIEGSHGFGRTITASGRYSIGRTRLFNQQYSDKEKLLIDRVYGPDAKVASVSASITRTTRDDPAEPTRGTLLLLDGSLASQKLGSDVGYLRGFASGFAYRSVPVLGGSVLAVGARLGLVTGFSHLVPVLDSAGQPVVNPGGQPVYVRVTDVPTSERFFAGGDNTVRGFDQDQLGADDVLDVNGVSSGGNALLILNSELRFPLLRSIGLGGAAFVDVGNVFARVNDMNIRKLRTGLGFGIRWRSPVGPLRIDLGWKATQHTFGNGVLEPRFTPYISIGQAF